MYDHAYPAPVSVRDVIAAWLVCLAVAGAVFVYPGLLAEPAQDAQTALGNTAPAGSRAELCAVHSRQIGEAHG